MKTKNKFLRIVLLIIPALFIIISTLDNIAGSTENNINIYVAVNDSQNIIGWGGARSFYDAIDNYTWIIGGNYTYHFYPNMTYTSDILNETLSEYSVFSYMGLHDEEFICGFPTIKATKIKLYLEEFISNGGGWVGSCSGASFPLFLGHLPETFDQKRLIHLNGFINCDATLKEHNGLPFFSEYFYIDERGIPRCCLTPWTEDRDPTRIGGAAYLFYSGSNIDNESHHFSGAPLICEVTDSNHPIFKDYLEDTWPVRWVGGASFNIPWNNQKISRLAFYPSDGVDFNNSTNITAWQFPLPPTNFWPEVWQAILDVFDGGFENITTLSIWFNEFFEMVNKLEDWDPTTMDIKTGLEDRPALIAFSYPNAGGGRLVLCGGHPESYIWEGEGNYIEDLGNSSSNSLWDGLHQWRNDNGTPDNTDDDRPLNESDKLWPNIWFLRRETAWASKLVPDRHLPPVYNRSQVVDFDPVIPESEEFNIDCCVGANITEMNSWTNLTLNLYYRYYNTTISNWTEWTEHSIHVYDIPYTFTFNASETDFGDGRYEFYSILETINESGTITDSPPPDCDGDGTPDADAWAFVGGPVLADFNYSPSVAYVNETVHFWDQSYSINGEIEELHWSCKCGDQEEEVYCYIDPYGKMICPTEVNFSFGQAGTASVTLNITDPADNYASITKNITVINNPPTANFTVSPETVRIGENVSYIDNSTDIDGTIINRTWDFGDGTTSEEQNPISQNHSYSDSGFYTISLTVTDNNNTNDTEIKQECILVADSIVNTSLGEEDPDNSTWTTLQKGIDNSSTLDIIYVCKGIYTEDIVVNKSLTLIGEDREETIINGSVTMNNPFDYELPNNGSTDWVLFFNMTGTNLLMHVNNDSSVGEDYSTSDFVYDYSGLGNSGTKYGALWNEDCLKGKGCFEFNGVNNSINLSSISPLSDENVSISAWIYWTEGSGNLDPILSQRNGYDQGYVLFVNATSEKPVFKLDDTESVSPVSIDSGWHHLAGTHNSTHLSIYVDGELMNSVSKMGSGQDVQSYIGYDAVSDFFNGKIDEVALWNRTLSDEEIFDLYNGNFGVFMEGFTIANASIGITPSNHSEISWCKIVDTTIGIDMNYSEAVRVYGCNISNSDIGIRINNSTPDEYNKIRIVDCDIDYNTQGITIASSTNMRLIYVNFTNQFCGGNDTKFSGCNASTIDIFLMEPSCNVAPNVTNIPSGPTLGDPNVSYNFSVCTNDSNGDQFLYQFDWGDGNFSDWLGYYESNESINTSHTWTNHGEYYIRARAKDVFNNDSNWSDPLNFKTDNVPPEIVNVSATPETVGFGFNVTIQANVTDNISGVDTVKVYINPPGISLQDNYIMNNIGGNTYECVFDETWTVGQYNYSIWAIDNANNSNTSSGHSFNGSAQATMSICTVEDSYGTNEDINITDPPNPPEGPYDTYSAPQNSFGMQTMKLVNWSYFWDFFDQHAHWALERYDTGSEEWVSCPEAFTVIKQRSDDNATEKISLDFTAPVTADYRLSFIIDEPVMDAVDQGVVHQYLLNYVVGEEEVYPVFFNWSDMIGIQGLTFDHGIVNDVFTFSVTKENIPEGLHVILDPTFGFEDTSTGSVIIEDNIVGSFATCGQNGTAQYISAYLYPLSGYFGPVKCALYEYIDYNDSYAGTFVAETEEKILLGGGNGAAWYTFAFSDPKPTLTADTTYYLVAWGESGTGFGCIKGVSRGTTGIIKLSETYNGFPDPLVNETNSPYNYSIYCSYSVPPSISTPSPADGTTNVSLTPTVQISVNETDGEPMTIIWLSNSSGSWVPFGTNISVSNGTYQQTFSNATENGKWWYWKVNVTNGLVFNESQVFKFYTGLQSKITNTGSTNISGYLLIQVQYYNETLEDWVVDNDTINETTPRTINVSEQLALDLIFNGLVNTDDLVNGSGTYRVYAAFRDPYNNILQCDDESSLAAWYEFNVE